MEVSLNANASEVFDVKFCAKRSLEALQSHTWHSLQFIDWQIIIKEKNDRFSLDSCSNKQWCWIERYLVMLIFYIGLSHLSNWMTLDMITIISTHFDSFKIHPLFHSKNYLYWISIFWLCMCVCAVKRDSKSVKLSFHVHSLKRNKK